MHDTISVRHAKLSDIKDIMHIQTVCYPPELLEAEATFARILEKARNVCFVAEVEGYGIVGFLLTHPWSDIFNPPELHNFNPEEISHGHWGRIYYVHDMSVLPEWRCHGIGTRLFESLLDKIEDSLEDMKPVLTLVSVKASIAFWTRLGFKQVACSQSILSSYKDSTSIYMLRQ